MKYYLIWLFVCMTSMRIYSQAISSFYFETDLVTKISQGKSTRKNINYAPGISANVPKNSRFNNPVFGIELSLNYKLDKYISCGIGSGINITIFDNHPIIAYEYVNKVLIPTFIKIQYLQELPNNAYLGLNINPGYQFADIRYGNTIEGFYYNESGGLTLNANIFLGYDLGAHSIQLNAGYEINEFSHEDSLGGLNAAGLHYSDKIFYKTYYHLLKLGIGIKI